MKLIEAIEAVEDEYLRAYSLYGDFASYHEGYAVLLEEVDELWGEIKKKQPSRGRINMEAKQIAAMALKLMTITDKD